MPYQPEKHRLETVTFHLKIPTAQTGPETTLRVAGRSQFQRTDLWTYAEVWEREDPTRDLSPVDALHWVALGVWQDRPTSTFQLNRTLRGEPPWEQLTLC